MSSPFTFHLTGSFTEGFLASEAAAAVSTVPFPYDVALAGLAFRVDTKHMEDFNEQSIKLLRPQTDDSSEPGEQSVNPEDFWRRSQSSWHHGAGQDYLDRGDDIIKPDRQRFRRSKGVDVFTPYEVSLLFDTDEKRNSANNNLYMTPAGSRLYVTDGQSTLYTTDPTAATWSMTTVTSTPAVTALGIASDGYHVWTVYNASGIYGTTTSSSAASQIVTSTVDGAIAFVKGRLICSSGASVYNVTDFTGPAALPTALYTHPNSDFDWIGFCEGRTVFYGAGYSGDKGEIFRFGIKSDGSGLNPGIQAGKLPDGEIPYGIAEYLGFIFIGTTHGFRMCVADDNGDLIIGDLIETPAPVYAFEGQGSFVWFSWSNYDATSTGLGRAYLRVLTGTPSALTPAYASDLMVTSQGNVVSIATFNEKRYFGISGDGFYGQDTNLVASGTLDSGWITFGIPDPKVGMYLLTRYAPNFEGSIAVSVAVDGSETYTSLGSHTESSADELEDLFQIGELRAERFDVRQTFARDGSDATLGPTLTGYIFKAQPGVQTRQRITVPLLIFDPEDVEGGTIYRDPEDDVATLREYCENQTVTTLQIGNISRSVVIENYLMLYDRKDPHSGAWSTTCIAVCKTV